MKSCIFTLVLIFYSFSIYADGVTIGGDVENPTSIQITDGARINDILEKVQVRESAYYVGAIWTRESEKENQRKLKAGILYELNLLENNALLYDQEKLAEMVRRLKNKVMSMPVTGRIIHPLDPLLIIGTNKNKLIENGDSIFYPPRPTQVHIIGAVEKDCDLEFKALKKINYYLTQCAIYKNFTTTDFVFVIEPDGNVFKIGTTLWNQNDSVDLAPGAIIFVPIRRKLNLYHNNELESESFFKVFIDVYFLDIFWPFKREGINVESRINVALTEFFATQPLLMDKKP